MKEIDKAFLILKELIELNGPDCLKKNPYVTYEHLIKDVDISISLAILGYLTYFNEEILEQDDASLSKEIQSSLGFKKSIIDDLIKLLRKLYSKENIETLVKKERRIKMSF